MNSQMNEKVNGVIYLRTEVVYVSSVWISYAFTLDMSKCSSCGRLTLVSLIVLVLLETVYILHYHFPPSLCQDLFH